MTPDSASVKISGAGILNYCLAGVLLVELGGFHAKNGDNSSPDRLNRNSPRNSVDVPGNPVQVLEE